jgi:restriction endonuclease S subunit
MKILEVSLSEIGKNPNHRLDFRLHSYLSKPIPFSHSPFKKVISSLSNGEDISKDYYVGEESSLVYPTVNNLKKWGFDFSNLTFLDEGIKANKRLNDGDLLIGRSGTVGVSRVWNKREVEILLGQSVEAVPSGYLIVAQLNTELVNPKFAEHYLNSLSMAEYFYVFGVGKTQKNISQTDILNIPFPNLSKAAQDETIAKIEPIECEIHRLQGTISDPAEAISRVFAREFGFDLAKFEALKRQKIFFIDLRDFANNHDLRCSVKFHRKAAKFVESELRSRTDKLVEDFLAENIVLGASVSPDNYDDDGEFYYVAMSSIKGWSFDKESARYVSDDYANKNQAKSVKEADIIMARSGEGTIGKVALIVDDVQGIFADFTMRIRLKDYDPEFAYYYFRTQYVQYLIETHKKGLGNNTNIFPGQIKEFPMLDIPLTRQEKIVREIQKEFSAQDEIKRKIEVKRKEIDRIIEQVLAYKGKSHKTQCND